MKPLSPHDPLDDLIAAALHGELTPEERTQFESHLQTDPAARTAYQEAQAMHDLLEKTHHSAQPDPAFEQRMVSGVRRKMQTEKPRETAWGSVVALWAGVRALVGRKRKPIPYLGAGLAVTMMILVLAGVALGPITNGIKQTPESRGLMPASQAEAGRNSTETDSGQAKGVFSTTTGQLADASTPPINHAPDEIAAPPSMQAHDAERLAQLEKVESRYQKELQANPDVRTLANRLKRIDGLRDSFAQKVQRDESVSVAAAARLPSIQQDQPTTGSTAALNTYTGGTTINGMVTDELKTRSDMDANKTSLDAKGAAPAMTFAAPAGSIAMNSPDGTDASQARNATATMAPLAPAAPGAAETSSPAATAESPTTDTRKLIRNAQLDLQVKSFQPAMDQITAMTNAAGGYVDTSNSQKGGNGKLQGTVVVKVLPQNLDAFLLKLRDLGQVQNQSVSTDDVTKDYFDTQSRLENSRRMETQLQDLLKHENSKVSDLLQVERELGRVRGEIEQMQGQLKLYDFQVQYATVTIQLSEKDLNQAAAYLLKEQDDFSLFATDVEATFQKARQTADDFKAQVLAANLNHNSGSDVSAELEVMVAPDQIEPFLAAVRSLGRVANFTRQTQRVANDGGDSNEPADQTLTEKDKVQVHLAIRSDDETRKQVALTVVAKAVDDALDRAKAAALANAGVEILGSSLNKTPQGQSTAELSVRVPGKDYMATINAMEALGRTASLSIQRNDDSGPGANGDDAPVIVSLSLTDDDTPLQETEMSVIADDVDQESQQIKKDAASAGVEVKASSFERQPDGTEMAQMTFRLPMAKYPVFVESVKRLGKVESLSVHRDDRPDQTQADETAPAEITLQLHNQRDLVADDSGLWPTLRQTFGDGAAALFGSVRVIGVTMAFLAPWVFTLLLLAWGGRRIYVWRRR
jgi:hypothetical protein